MAISLGDLYARNRSTMGRAAGIGGTAGTNPIGDRPGTTTLGGHAPAWQTPAGRAHYLAAGAFALIVFLHLAAENRTA